MDTVTQHYHGITTPSMLPLGASITQKLTIISAQAKFEGGWGGGIPIKETWLVEVKARPTIVTQTFWWLTIGTTTVSQHSPGITMLSMP